MQDLELAFTVWAADPNNSENRLTMIEIQQKLLDKHSEYWELKEEIK